MVQSYGALERTQTIIVGCLLSFILLATFASQPDWLAALYGTFVPTLPAYAPWVAERFPAIAARSPWIELGTYLGAIGGGTQDYFGYIGMLREKGWGLLGRTTEAGREGVTIATDAMWPAADAGCVPPWPTPVAASSALSCSPWPSPSWGRPYCTRSRSCLPACSCCRCRPSS